jgi:hypothetical protein
MGAVRSEKVTEKGSQGPFLIASTGNRNGAAAAKASLAKAATEQSRDRSSFVSARTQQLQAQLLNKPSHFFSKLNRQTPELETTLTSRKQRTANCSNRQKMQFCKPRNSRSTSANLCPEQLSQGLAQNVFLARLGLEFSPAPAQARSRTRLATSHSQLVTVISNRELLVLEILQPAENKHRPRVLIENSEPNRRLAFRAFVAAAFRRAAFACQLPIQAGESLRARGCR